MPSAPEATPGRPRPSPEAIFAVLAPLLSGGLSLWLGGDLNYDLRHYHFYNGYALVNDRFDLDFAPAGIQSFLNPLQDGLYYLGIRHLAPRLFGFLLGALHGLNAVLVHLVARRALAGDPWRRWLALAAGALALFGSNALSLLGTTCGDNLVSLPLLAALWLALDDSRPGWLLAAGFAAGIAAGMKLTMLVPGAALAVALVATARPAAAGIFRLGLGSLLGFLATGGFWSWRLLDRFSSPVFPVLNGVFRSPFFRPDSLIEPRFAAHAWWEAATLPLEMALGWTSGLQEIRFHEPRFLLVLGAVLAWLLARVRATRGADDLGAPERRLVVFWLAGFGLWVYGLHYYRYATVLELLAPAVAFVLLRRTPWGRAPVLAAVALLVLVGARPVDWGRFPWGGDWFAVRLPALSRLEESLVIVAGERASYVAPSFPEETRFVGLTRRGSPWLDGQLIGKLRAHAGPILLLQGVGATPREAERFGLAAAGDCMRIETRDGGLCLFELRRR